MMRFAVSITIVGAFAISCLLAIVDRKNDELKIDTQNIGLTIVDDECAVDANLHYYFNRDQPSQPLRPFGFNDADDGAKGDQYGWSVAISTELDGQKPNQMKHSPVMVVGAPFADLPKADDCGAVYVYQTDSTDGDGVPIWTLVDKLYAPRIAQSANFGWVVGTITINSRNFIFVGEPSISARANNMRPGQTYVFELHEEEDISDSYIEIFQILSDEDGHAGDQFGCSLDVSHLFYPSQNPDPTSFVWDNLMLAVGARGADDRRGTVELFSYFYSEDDPSVTFWGFTNELRPNPGTPRNTWFGFDVAVSLNTTNEVNMAEHELAIIVGAPRDGFIDAGGNFVNKAGSIYIFEGEYQDWDPGSYDSWDPRTPLPISTYKTYDCKGTINANDQFGFSVDIMYYGDTATGNVVASIGVWRDDYDTYVDIGSGRLMDRDRVLETWDDAVCYFIRPAGLELTKTGQELKYGCVEGDDMRFGYSTQLVRDRPLSNPNARDYEVLFGAPFDPYYEMNPEIPHKRGRVYAFGKTVDEHENLSQIMQDVWQVGTPPDYFYEYTPDNEYAWFGRSIAITPEGNLLMIGAPFYGQVPEGRSYLHQQFFTTK